MATIKAQEPPLPSKFNIITEWILYEVIQKPLSALGTIILLGLNIYVVGQMLVAFPLVTGTITAVWALLGFMIVSTFLRVGHTSGTIRDIQLGFYQSLNGSLLTLLLSLIAAALAAAILGWAINTAQWDAIFSNMTLLLVGRYERDQLWRPEALTFLTVALAGATWLAFGPQRANIPQQGRNTLIILWLLLIPFAYYFLGASFLGFHEVPSELWGGLMLTLLISATAIVASFPIGVLLALGRRSTLPVVKLFCTAFIEFWRGVPLIAVLFTANFMLPLLLPPGTNPPGLLRVLVALTIFSSAYLAENVRGGLQAIPKGQYEAAEAIGLNNVQSMLYIILPQALRAVIPAIVGQFIGLVKDTTLVSLVGLFDLLGIAKAVLAQPQFLGAQQEVYAFLFVVFWVICYSLAMLSRWLENKLNVVRR